MAGTAALPPGPRLGRVYQTLGWWYRPLSLMERCRDRFGDRFTLRLVGVPPIVVLSSTGDVREVLTADPDMLLPGAGTRLLEPIVGRHSVGLMDGREHLAERKLLMPALHGERLAAMAGTMEAEATAAVDRWPASEPVALHPLMIDLTLAMVVKSALGLDEGNRRFASVHASLLDLFTWNARLPNLVPRTRRTVAGRGPWARLLAARERTDRMLFDLIECRRTTGADDGDVLAFLLSARYEDGSAMSDRQIRDELMTLIAAGHQTLALALTWACGQVARNPRVLQRLNREIDAGVSDEYLTATVRESLRHRPVIPIGPRCVAREATIGGWRYPPGVLLQAEAYLLHHDPAVYRDPYAFRPERFIEEPADTYTWIPFGGGRRRCIGFAFAMLEMKAILRALLRARDLQPVGSPESTRRHNIGLVPKDGGRITLPLRITSAA